MRAFEVFLSRELLNPGTLPGAIAYGVVIVAVAWVAARMLRLTVEAAMARVGHPFIDRTSAVFVAQLAQIAIYVIALTTYAHVVPYLRTFGTALLTGVGVASVVVGLAAQNTLGNIIAGFSLLLYRPFAVNDQLQIAAPSGLESGVVENLTLGYTVLRTFDNRRVVVPNSVMATQVTINMTARDPRVMLALPIGVGYAADLDRARSILVDLARGHDGVLSVVDCPVTRLGESAVTLTLRAWCVDVGAAKQAEYALYEQAKRRFDEAHIEIPFPSRNIIVTMREQGIEARPGGRSRAVSQGASAP